MQCKDIPDRPILEMLARHPNTWHNWFFGNEFDVGLAMPADTPEKLKLAKMRMMIRRGVVDGCGCGCRGDFTITEKGLAEIAPLQPNFIADLRACIAKLKANGVVANKLRVNPAFLTPERKPAFLAECARLGIEYTED